VNGALSSRPTLGRLDAALAVLVALLWGVNFVAARVAVQEVPPVFLLAVRFGLVAILLVGLVRIPRHQLGGLLLVSTTLGTLHFSLMFSGMRGVDAGTAALIVQLQVPFSALLAAIIERHRPRPLDYAGMVVAYLGVLLIAGEPRLGDHYGHLLLIVAAAFVWAVANFQIKRLGGLDGITLNAWICLLAVPQLLLVSLLLESGQWQALVSASWKVWGSLAYMVLAVTILGYGLWYRLLARYPVSRITPFTLLVPVFGVLSGALLLGEPLTLRVIGGGAMTLVGVMLIVFRRGG
jgi:O-acetylserine/cysteine efflux transporter